MFVDIDTLKVSWIASSQITDDPRNHTNQHERN
jgi:hypothetical protein